MDCPGQEDLTTLMFRRTSPRALTLEVEDQVLTFPTLGEFQFALASRTEVTTAKISSLVRVSDEALDDEAQAIKKVEKHLVEMMTANVEDQDALAHALQGLDIKLFSQDHQWRSIMSALRGQTSAYDDYKKLALVKYMQYLSARQEIVKSIYAERQQRTRIQPFTDKPDMPAPDQPFRDTVGFELAATNGEKSQREGFTRLPKGEVVAIGLQAGQELALSLAGHGFRLLEGSPSRLVGENGDQHILQQGKNLVGRELGNHIVVDGSYRDVSRKHLLIDLSEPRTARLTDVSSHGTFVRADALEKS